MAQVGGYVGKAAITRGHDRHARFRENELRDRAKVGEVSHVGCKPTQDSPSADSGQMIQENPDDLLNGALAREQKRTDRRERSVSSSECVDSKNFEYRQRIRNM